MKCTFTLFIAVILLHYTAFAFDFHEIKFANFARNTLSDYAKYSSDFIRAGSDPFFLSVNYPDAHDPWVRQIAGLPSNPQGPGDVKAIGYIGIDPPGMREMVADYYNCLSRLDTLVGDLLDVLDRSGKADNTIVIYKECGQDFPLAVSQLPTIAAVAVVWTAVVDFARSPIFGQHPGQVGK